jgi:hypothetical protein
MISALSGLIAATNANSLAAPRGEDDPELAPIIELAEFDLSMASFQDEDGGEGNGEEVSEPEDD